MANSESRTVAGIRIDAVAAYDIKPGAPAHPRGEANGYVLTIGGKRLLLAGVTECVPEIRALPRIDIAFMPMNIPVGRMTPAAAAECTRALRPKVVYLYHYDQDYASRVANPSAAQAGLPGGITIAQSLDAFRAALNGSGIDVRSGNWYPPR
jgi:L-ascorbate metabolism protein UlaG (beta-lactamase superfamily)